MNEETKAVDPTPPAAEGGSRPMKPKKERARIKHPGILLYLEWEDHHSQDDWVSDEDVDCAPIIAKTVGWLHSENDNVVVVYSNYAGENNTKPYSNVMTILKKTIIKRVILK